MNLARDGCLHTFSLPSAFGNRDHGSEDREEVEVKEVTVFEKVEIELQECRVRGESGTLGSESLCERV